MASAGVTRVQMSLAFEEGWVQLDEEVRGYRYQMLCGRIPWVLVLSMHPSDSVHPGFQE